MMLFTFLERIKTALVHGDFAEARRIRVEGLVWLLEGHGYDDDLRALDALGIPEEQCG